jgi:tRNA C32,U32 (ribose-2'-O)-methylase TrmJ
MRSIDKLRNEIGHTCIQAAMDAIDVLEMNLIAPRRVMGCIAVFAAFSAATVLVAATVVPDLVERYSLPGIQLSRALSILRNDC